MATIVFNSQNDWVAAMQKAANYYTTYKNWYPYNLLYWDGGTLSADCSNFQKALFNGGNPFNLQRGMNAGRYWPNNTGDCTEWGLLSQCSGISQNFWSLTAGQPELLYMNGHIGAYIGKEVWINGYAYNVIECTAWTGDFGHTGIIYTYVDGYGRRLNHKNGGYQCGAWSHHGKPTKWVKYSTPAPTPPGKLTVDGEWGINTTKATQKFLGTEQDGIVSNQPIGLKPYCMNCLTESWQFVNSTSGYSPMIKALQKWCGLGAAQQDGHFGPVSIRAFQRKLGVSADSFCGPDTVRAWQTYLNKNLK